LNRHHHCLPRGPWGVSGLFAAALSWFVAVNPVPAQPDSALPQLPPGMISVQSLTRQFTVSGSIVPSILPDRLYFSPASNWTRIDPRLLTISCERVKETVLSHLNAPDQWRGRVSINVHPIRSLEDPVLVNAVRFSDGWLYRLEMPDAMARDRFVRTLTRVILQERANRGMREVRQADLPEWLPEGLASEILADNTLDLLLSPPDSKINNVPVRRSARQTIRASSMVLASEHLRAHPPLSLEDLSWSQPARLTGDALMTYRYSSQLLVRQLLRLPDGPESINHFLELLPTRLNWQIAFTSAFHKHFPRMIDFEKWWELQVAQLLSGGSSLVWDAAESLHRLEAIITIPVSVSTSPKVPGKRTNMSLQEFLATATPEHQLEAIQFIFQQLESAMPRFHQNVAPLAEAYRHTAEWHLRRSEPQRYSENARRRTVREKEKVLRETIHELDQLDSRRAGLSGKSPEPPPASPVTNPAP
jgi:hypothetical protein